MTTQYTPTLKLALPVTGELSGTWGDTVNDNITSMIEQAIAGLSTINTWTANAHTLTTANGTTSESRCAMLVAATGGGAPTAAADIICPAAAKLYVLQNNTSFAVTLKTSAGTGVAVAAGDTAFLFCDATNVNSCVTTIVNGNITGNLTVGGNATINGNTTLGNATSDTITATARFNTDLVPSTDNARDLGSAANSWKDLFIDGTATMALVAISGGTINGVSIGATTAATLINVDNLRLDGNTLSSTDTNGNVVIAPNGTGDVQLDADTVRVGDAAAAATLTSNGAGALTVTTGGAADLTLSTNSGTTSGTVVIANGANGNITLTPDGTGDVILSADRVQMGDSNTDTTLTTNGTGSLNLTTNNGTNSGTVQIAQGVNGNITLTPNGTGSVSISKLYSSGNTILGATSANTLSVAATITSNLLFTDATYDIGASGATRPRDLFLSRNLTVGGTLTLTGGVNLNGNVTVGDSSADTLTINSTITSNLIFTDNTYDIGASGATRPRTLYLAGNAIVGGVIRIGAATSDELLTINGSSAGFIARITNTVASNPSGLYVNSTNAIGTGTAFRVDSAGSALLTLNSTGLQVTSTLSGGTSGTGYSFSGSAPATSLTLDASGQLGIGEATPTQKVHAKTASTTYYLAETTGTSASAGFRMKAGASADYTLFTTQGVNQFAIYDNAAGSQRVTLDSSGNLGVGTSSPAYNLEVSKSQDALTNIAITNASSGTAAQTRLRLNNGGGNFGAITHLGASYTTSGVFRQDGTYIYGNGTGGLTFTTGAVQPIYFAISNSEVARIDSSGNLGIGSTTSLGTKGKLGVYGTGDQTDESTATATFGSWDSGGMRLYFGVNNTNEYTYIGSVESATSYRSLVLQPNGGNVGIGTTSPPVTLSVNGTVGIFGGSLNGSIGSPQLYRPTSDTLAIATGATERMRIDSSGNLGIGTSSPFGTAANRICLSVNGTTDASINVGSGGVQRAYLYGTASLGQIGTIGALPLVFAPNDTERARINSSGDLLVAVTNDDPTFNRTNGVVLRATGNVLSRSSGGSDFGCSSTSGTNISFYSDNGSARVTGGNISTNGSVTSYNVTSDRRLKQNIESLQNGLAKVLQLKPSSYNYVEGNQYSAGFIADELQSVIPEAVTGTVNGIDEEGKPVYQSVDSSFLIPHLVKAIQEQQALITSLTARITALETA